MRASLKANYASGEKTAVAAAVAYRFSPSGQDEEDSSSLDRAGIPSSRPDDLPYSVELWDAAKQAVEQVLAVTRNGSIGYAAYYEATRQFPTRYVVLRHKGRILSRWNGPTH